MTKAEVIPTISPPIRTTTADLAVDTSCVNPSGTSLGLYEGDDGDLPIVCVDYDDNSSDNHSSGSNINIVNSSDVIIGSVTQYHGPVTIVQHLQQQDQELQQSITDGNRSIDKANMNYSALPSKLQTAATRTCLPKRLLLCFATLAVIVVIVVASIIIAIELPASTPGDGTDFFIDNETSTISTTEISTADYHEGDGLSTVTVDAPKFIANHRFYSVADWRGRQPLYTIEVSQPISFVIVSHTAGVQCFTFADCATQMRNIQALHVNNGSPNIGYNFLIGGDGGIYEARGWHTRNFHRDFTIGISFMGNFVFDEFTDVMISAFDGILANGVKVGVLPANFRIVAHNQTTATASPGQHIYSVISQYPNFYPGLLPSAREPDVLR